METVIKKLSEIEIAAKKIMEDADARLNQLTEQMQDKITAFDTQVEKDTAAQLSQLQQRLQEQTNATLSRLKTDTEKLLISLDDYYNNNHDRISDGICRKIIRM